MAHIAKVAPAPLRLPNALVQRIAAEEIDRTAAEITIGAAEVAETLRELAETIRRQTKVAHQQITAFCRKASFALDTIPDLQRRLDKFDELAKFAGLDRHLGSNEVDRLPPAKRLEQSGRARRGPEVQTIRSEIPAFLKRGPADFENRRP